MNIIKSIWNYKCPRCRQGDMFVKPFTFNNPLNMHDSCDHCGQRFTPEPGYYFGAMFISYIWTGWSCLFIVGFCMIVLGWSVYASFALLLAITVLTFFWIARISRSMYIHMDVRYDPNKTQKTS